MLNLKNSDLETLVITGNKVDSYDGFNFKLKNLITLDLSNNSLKMIDSNSFAKLSSLNNLFLQENSLTVLKTGVFDPLVNLKVLNISFNEIKEMTPFNIFFKNSKLILVVAKGLELELYFDRRIPGITFHSNLSYFHLNYEKNISQLLQELDEVKRVQVNQEPIEEIKNKKIIAILGLVGATIIFVIAIAILCFFNHQILPEITKKNQIQTLNYRKIEKNIYDVPPTPSPIDENLYDKVKYNNQK